MEVFRVMSYILAVVVGGLWLHRQTKKRRYDLHSMPGTCMRPVAGCTTPECQFFAVVHAGPRALPVLGNLMELAGGF